MLPRIIDLIVRSLISIGLIGAAVFNAAAQRRGAPIFSRPANPTAPAQLIRPRPPVHLEVGPHAGGAFWHHPSSSDATGPVPYILPFPVYIGTPYEEGVPLTFENPYGSTSPVPVQPSGIPMAMPSAPVTPKLEEGIWNTEAGMPSGQTCPQPARDEPVQFFIALKDNSVFVAVAYWILDETLHYLTPQGSHNLVSLELVDRALSAKLNSSSHLQFILPPETSEARSQKR